MKRATSFFCVFTLLLVLACFFHRECLFSEAGIANFDSEYRGFILPRLEFLKYNYTQNLSSLWNPFILTGTPFMAHPEVQFFYLPRVITVFLFSPETSDRVFVAFHVLIAALGTFLYVRSLTKNFDGALLAAALCVICGPTTVMIASGNEITLPMLCWWPYTLWATDRFALTGEKKYLLVITAGLWLSILAQQLQIFAFMAIYYLFYLLIIFSETKRDRRAFVLRQLILSGLAAVFLSGIQLIPTLELAALSNRLRSYAVANSDPLKLYSLLTLIWPPVVQFSKNNWQGFVLYFGFFPFLSALWAVRSGNRMLLNGFFAVTLTLMAAGLPVYWLFYKFFPFGRYMNGGEELTFALAFFIPVMAGVGWASLTNKINTSWAKNLLLVLAISECFWWGVSYYANVRRVPPQNAYALQEEEIAGLIKQKNPMGRLLKYGHTDDVFMANLSMSHRIQSITGFYNFAYKNFSDLLQRVEESMVGKAGIYGDSPDVRAVRNIDNVSLPMFDMMGTRYIVSFEYFKKDQYVLMYDNTVKLYENTQSLPRAFLVDNYKIVTGARERIDLLTSREYRPEQILYLTRKPVWISNDETDKTRANDYVKIVTYEPDKIVIDVQSTKNSLLFMAEMYHPGWRARVDGQEAEVYETNHAFRSVAIPQGTHTVTMYYKPASLDKGVILFFAGLVLIMMLLKIQREPRYNENTHV